MENEADYGENTKHKIYYAKLSRSETPFFAHDPDGSYAGRRIAVFPAACSVLLSDHAFEIKHANDSICYLYYTIKKSICQ